MEKKYRLQTNGFLMNIRGSSGVTLKKLNTFDYLCDLPEAQQATDFVEVQFKNTRKGYYLNSNKLPLVKGDVVAVEASPGHDIGTVTMTGYLVLKQMKKTRYRFDQEVKRVYRKARPADLEKFEEAKAKEHDTMLRSRKIAEDLHLEMKIGDVEYQGDGNKAIFYYIADGRVDFRELIKVLADTFHIRIEMKQIGARQEAGRIGGIGPCGREMCCSSWMTNFVSVSTTAARYQDLSLNPQKLAGQCAKLKCCINYETDMYVEAQKDFPAKDIVLETKEASYYPVKNDILKHLITYSTSKDTMANLETIPVERALRIIALNKQGVKVESLSDSSNNEPVVSAFGDVLGNDDYTRFDKPRHGGKSGKKHNHSKDGDRRAEGKRDGNPNGQRSEGKGQNSNAPRPEGKRNGQPNSPRHEGKREGQNNPNATRHDGKRNNGHPRPEKREDNSNAQRPEGKRNNGNPQPDGRRKNSDHTPANHNETAQS